VVAAALRVVSAARFVMTTVAAFAPFVPLAIVALAVVARAIVALAIVALAVVARAIVALAIVALAVVARAIVPLAIVALAVVARAVVPSPHAAVAQQVVLRRRLPAWVLLHRLRRAVCLALAAALLHQALQLLARLPQFLLRLVESLAPLFWGAFAALRRRLALCSEGGEGQ